MKIKLGEYWDQELDWGIRLFIKLRSEREREFISCHQKEATLISGILMMNLFNFSSSMLIDRDSLISDMNAHFVGLLYLTCISFLLTNTLTILMLIESPLEKKS